MVGVSLALISLAPIARTAGLPDRAAYTAAGLAIVAFWLAPGDTWDFIADFSTGYGVFLAGGLLVVVGATWVIVYNAPLLLGGLGWLLGRVGAVAPIVRLAVAYPLRSLFRTGVMLAMFTLVVFTLVVGVTVSSSFTTAMDDDEKFGGGFDVRAVAAPASPISGVAAAVAGTPGVTADDVSVAAAQTIVPLEAKQAGTGRPFESYPVTGLDDAFLARTTYDLSAVAHGYRSADDVWRALRAEPGLAVVDPAVAPRRDNYNMAVPPDFQLTGFYVEDERFAAVPVTIRDSQTGQTMRVKVIGVLADTAPLMMAGISTSQETLERAIGPRAVPNVYWLDLAPGVEPRGFARGLESAFLANGLEAESLEETLDDLLAYSRTFNYLVEGFMGLGLLVGVAALGVISARSVVERRQQIGVLRSIGFQQRLIQAAFLAETAFIALTSIVLGTVLGLAISYSIIADTAKQPSWTGLAMDVPWAGLAVVFTVVMVVALATTYLPARRAAGILPAEALRYQ
jgi:putative ABC transport system permease protein